MKQLTIILLFVSLVCNAQYKDLKKKYNYHNYKYELGDPYNPTFAGGLSLLVPGLGQVYCGETWRGIAHFGIASACLLFGSYRTVRSDGSDSFGVSKLSFILFALIDLNSILDASRVAKTKNLAYRDIKISPSPNGVGLVVNF